MDSPSLLFVSECIWDIAMPFNGLQGALVCLQSQDKSNSNGILLNIERSLLQSSAEVGKETCN